MPVALRENGLARGRASRQHGTLILYSREQSAYERHLNFWQLQEPDAIASLLQKSPDDEHNLKIDASNPLRSAEVGSAHKKSVEIDRLQFSSVDQHDLSPLR